MVLENISKDILNFIPGMNAHIKFLVVLTTVGLYFAWIVAPTPETADAFVRAHELTMPPYSKLPSFLWLALNFWVLIILGDALLYIEKVNSDTLIIEGLDHTESCNAGNIMEKGDSACILAGGIKLFERIFPGNIAVFVPRTHLYTFGRVVITDAFCDPSGDIKFVPYDWKDAIQPRVGGLTGINACVVGYMNNIERRKHLTFYPNLIDKSWEKTGTVFTTEGFITMMKKMSGHIDLKFQVDNNDTKGIKARLSVPDEIVKTTGAKEEPTGLSKLIYSGE